MQVQWAERREETSARPRERWTPPQRGKRRAKDYDGDSDYGQGGNGGPKRRRVEEVRREETLDSMNM